MLTQIHRKKKKVYSHFMCNIVMWLQKVPLCVLSLHVVTSLIILSFPVSKDQLAFHTMYLATHMYWCGNTYQTTYTMVMVWKLPDLPMNTPALDKSAKVQMYV